MKQALAMFLVVIALGFLIAQSSDDWVPDIILTNPDGSWLDTRVYSNFINAIGAAGTVNDRTLHVIREESVDNDLTIGENLTVHFLGAGKIIQTSGTTTVNGSIRSGDKVIFSTTGAGSFDFDDGKVLRTSWFDDFADAVDITTDDTVTLVVSDVENVTASDSLGDYVALEIEGPGNYLYIDSGVTLSNVKDVRAGRHLCFLGAGRVDFGDGVEVRSSWFERFDEAIRYIDDSEVSLLVDVPCTLNSDTTVLAGTVLRWDTTGNVITLNANLTVAGSFYAGVFQVVSEAGGALTFTNLPDKVIPQWWGDNTTPGTTDMAEEIQAAIDSNRRANVHLVTGRYLIGTTLDITTPVTISGDGDEQSILVPDSSLDDFVIKIDDCWKDNSGVLGDTNIDLDVRDANVVLRNFSIVGDRANAADGIQFYERNDNVLMQNVKLMFLKGKALEMGVSGDTDAIIRESRFEDITVWGCGDDGDSSPGVEISANHSGSATTNNLYFDRLQVIYCYDKHLYIHSNGTNIAHLRFTDSWVHGFGSDAAATADNLIEIEGDVERLDFSGQVNDSSDVGGTDYFCIFVDDNGDGTPARNSFNIYMLHCEGGGIKLAKTSWINFKGFVDLSFFTGDELEIPAGAVTGFVTYDIRGGNVTRNGKLNIDATVLPLVGASFVELNDTANDYDSEIAPKFDKLQFRGASVLHTPSMTKSTAAPGGVVTAQPGSLHFYTGLDGRLLNNNLWIKMYGSGNTDYTWRKVHYGAALDLSDQSGDYHIEAYHNGYLFTNQGAAATTNMSLPTADVGLRYKFQQVEDQRINLSPEAADQFRECGVVNKDVFMYDSGDGGEAYGNVEIICLEASIWDIMSVRGTIACQP